MSSTFSTNLALELIGTGDQAGSWGNTTNTNLGTLIEQAISGYVTQGVTTGNTTSITIPDGASGVARNMFIELTGTGGTNTVLAVPSNKKLYFIYNNASGAVTVKVGAGTGVSVPAGEKQILVSNGTDIVTATSYLTSVGTSLNLTTLTATSANITTLTSASATVTNLLGTTLTISGNSFLATSSGNVGIGTASPFTTLDVNGYFTAGVRNTTNISLTSGTHYLGSSPSDLLRNNIVGNINTDSTTPVRLRFYKSRGTSASPTAVSSGDQTNDIQTYAYDGASYIQATSIQAAVTATPSTNSISSALSFSTNGGSSSPSERMRIDSSGNVGIGTTTANKSSSSTALTVNTGTAANYSAVEWSSNNTLNYHINANDSAIYHVAAGTRPWIVYTNGSERMRITSGGNLLVGTTTDVSGRSGVISDVSGNVRAIPRVGSAKTAVYTLAISDVGQYVELGTGGAIDVPNAIFSTGDVVSVFNNTTGARTISLTITTAYLAGTDADKASVSLATRGVATILFISNSVCVVSGNVS